MLSGYAYALRYALNQAFPLVKHIRRGFWGLLLFSALLLLVTLPADPWPVQVVPVSTSPFFQKKVVSYNGQPVVMSGELLISNAGFAERLLLTNATFHFNTITLLFLAAISIVVLVMMRGMSAAEPVFRKDISPHIRLVGYLMLVHAIIIFINTFFYANVHVLYLTHNEFTVPTSIPLLSMAEAYAALMVLAIANWYRQGVVLKKEQDLII